MQRVLAAGPWLFNLSADPNEHDNLYARFPQRAAELKAALDEAAQEMLYPLNALIASQRERLDAWTAPGKGKLRYCLYNGDLAETASSRDRRMAASAAPQCVSDRTELRRSPPPVLVTNLTMLEYMLVRRKDAPIVAASRGRLKWIGHVRAATQ